MLTVELKSCGNPDFGQYAPLSPNKVVQIQTLADASKACCDYIASYNLGGGNWNGGTVRHDKTIIARVSYNGRIWGPDGAEVINEEILSRDRSA